jgi:5-methylcytosine-specific restriction endonuclease McrA
MDKIIKKRRNQFRTKIYDKHINEKIWERDNYKCVYCGKKIYPHNSMYEWCDRVTDLMHSLYEEKYFDYKTYMFLSNRDSLERLWKINYRKQQATIDHIIPITKNGTDDLSNLVSCCSSCNSKKSNKNKQVIKDGNPIYKEI